MAFCATEHTSRFEQRVKTIQVRPAVDFNDCVLDSFDFRLKFNWNWPLLLSRSIQVERQ